MAWCRGDARPIPVLVAQFRSRPGVMWAEFVVSSHLAPRVFSGSTRVKSS